MTSNEIIEMMTVDARKLGMKYGEYAEKYGHLYPKPDSFKSKDPNLRTCERCGILFRVSGGSPKYCPACVADVTEENEQQYKSRKTGKPVERLRVGTCALCGEEFAKTHGSEKYCKRCKLNARRQRVLEAQKRARERVAEMKTEVCACCGQKFHREHGSQKYCKECKPKVKRQQAREYKKRVRERQKNT